MHQKLISSKSQGANEFNNGLLKIIYGDKSSSCSVKSIKRSSSSEELNTKNDEIFFVDKPKSKKKLRTTIITTRKKRDGSLSK